MKSKMKDTKCFKDKNGQMWVKVEYPKPSKQPLVKQKLKEFSVPTVFWFNFVVNLITLLFIVQNYSIGIKAIVFSIFVILILLIVFVCIWDKI